MADTNMFIALAAGLGSLMGAGSSIATTWITQRTQSLRATKEWKLRERQVLYNEFITEASHLALDALTHSMEQPDQIMTLYGVLSRIRLVSSEDVVRHAEACCGRIIELYGRPNLTADQIRAVVADHKVDELDPLKEFSQACRNELQSQLV
jgi:hypothetical protein